MASKIIFQGNRSLINQQVPRWSGLAWRVEAAKVILFQNIKVLVGPLMVYASTKDFSCRQSSWGAGWSRTSAQQQAVSLFKNDLG